MDLAIKLIVLLPLLAAAIAGLFCRVIGDRPAQFVTCAALLIAAAPQMALPSGGWGQRIRLQPQTWPGSEAIGTPEAKGHHLGDGSEAQRIGKTSLACSSPGAGRETFYEI